MKVTKGESPMASQSSSKWVGKKRPRKWRGKVYGLAVHTTGASLPAKALYSGETVSGRAVRHYQHSHGTHYVNPYDGAVVQVANEVMQANGIGTGDQRSVMSLHSDEWPDYSFSGSISAETVWDDRWRGVYTDPLDLYPGKYANSCYVHVEMPPCVFWNDGATRTHREPLRPGLRFTRAQHEAVASLAMDLATRNNFSKVPKWWLTGRLAGHEDISPTTRSVSSGCWDPGALRVDPWFDWDFVYEIIESTYIGEKKSAEVLAKAQNDVKLETCVSPSDYVISYTASWLDGTSAAFYKLVSGLLSKGEGNDDKV